MLSPANGRPLVTPTQDMIIGAYYLTEKVDDATGEGRVFRDPKELHAAYERGDVSVHASIQFRTPDLLISPANGEAAQYEPTTVGRVFFNEALPDEYPYVNAKIDKKEMSQIVDDLARTYAKQDVAVSLDAIKDLCFHFAMKSGLTVSIDDVATPPEKAPTT